MSKGSMKKGDQLQIVRMLNPLDLGFAQRERKVMTVLTFSNLSQVCHSLR